jgi:hypothetical protein
MLTAVLTLGLAACLFAGSGAVAGTDPADACKDAKAKAAGGKAAALLEAFGKNVKRPAPSKLAADVSKAQSKLTRGFARAEGKGGCATTGDVGTIETKVDAFVADVLSDVPDLTTTTTGPVTTSTSTTATTASTSTSTTLAACDCCGVAGRLTFEATLPAGDCGDLRSFRCSEDASKACTTDADCTGACDEQIGLGLPLDFECGGLYVGGGQMPYPLPFLLSDTAAMVANVTSCDGGSGSLTLGPTTALETGSSRTCTGTGCLFGAPVPFANAISPPSSFCSILTLAQDATGTARCDGTVHLEVPISMAIYHTGDMLRSATPPDVPGVQSCPLCTTICVGGANEGFPCVDDSECNSGDCGSTGDRCLAGPNHGDPCTPDTSDAATLGDPAGAFPTSHDCPPNFPVSVPVGIIPWDLVLTTDQVTENAADLNGSHGGARVFCGFCRDSFLAGSGCFEGDTGVECPAAIPPATGNAVPCDSDADCADADEYESCAQRDPGAFSRAAATQMNLFGEAAGQCLGDSGPHAATFVSATCVPPTFSPINDASWDLPGPVAVSIQGAVQLSP